MKKTFLLTLLAVLAAGGIIFGFKYTAIRRAMAARAQQAMPPVTVAAASPLRQDWQTRLAAVATLESRQGIVVRTEVEGLVQRVAFTSGGSVAEGALLAALDTSREEAQLRGLVAAVRLAEVSLTRARELRQSNTNSAADLDIAEATHAQAQAAADLVRVAISKKRITAPFAGRLGITQVNPGQYLKAGDPLVQLEALDFLFADFGLPQQDAPLVAAGMAVRVTIDAFPNRLFPGTVEAVNPRVSDDTRNLRIRALLPNADGALRPGMFGRAEVMLPETKPVLVIPAAAVVYNPYGDSVFVVEAGVARQKFVQLGVHRGDVVTVLGGLAPTEQVVTAGQLKLRNGLAVRVDNSVAPDANPAPRPPES